MRKSVILSILILLFSTVYVSSYDYNYDDYNNYIFYENNREITSKTFHITHSNGRSYDRTFTNYNKHKKDYDSSKTDFERKGIYLDFFDTKDKQIIEYKIFSEILKIKKEVNCPEGWTCFK